MAVSSTVNGEEFNGDTEVGDYQSMSIIGSDASGDSASPAEALPTIQLSFDNTTGGNWDDRELIKVYDAAMSEFHAHHPGPGSWLDKATAALAVGNALPGSHAYDTENAQILTADGNRWYGASKPDEGRPPPAKRARRATEANGSSTVTEPVNPYSITRQSLGTAPAPPSPTYEPPSPPPEPSKLSPGPTRQPPDHHPRAADRSIPPEASLSNQGLLASAGAQQIEGVTADQALSYAMQAQYMAGFWMGVAQSRALLTREDRREDPQPSEGRPVSNVFITRQHFQQGAGRLRR
ncbi:hypothetical protein JCM24511_04280 [Saitozyma sp. JCM 24511]|nr:hypothetical protein JCM24511_04280 [Saitozyma sp. JCM 24511]